MPTYQAECKTCKERIQYIAKISEMDNTPNCMKCKKPMERTMIRNEGGFILKGSGFYKPGGFK